MPGTSKIPRFPLGDLSTFFSEDRNALFRQMISDHGEVFYAWSLTTPVVMIQEPELLRQVLMQDTGKFERDVSIAPALSKAIPKSLVKSSGKDWQKMYRVMHHTFRPHVLESFVPIMNQEIERLLSGIPENVSTQPCNPY